MSQSAAGGAQTVVWPVPAFALLPFKPGVPLCLLPCRRWCTDQGGRAMAAGVRISLGRVGRFQGVHTSGMRTPAFASPACKARSWTPGRCVGRVPWLQTLSCATLDECAAVALTAAQQIAGSPGRGRDGTSHFACLRGAGLVGIGQNRRQACMAGAGRERSHPCGDMEFGVPTQARTAC